VATSLGTTHSPDIFYFFIILISPVR